MTTWFPAMFALFIAAAGWFYLFYSRAAHQLADLEAQRLNARRVRLRRVNGVVLFLLAVAFYAGFYTVSWTRPTTAFLLVWFAVLILLAISLVLAMIDLRITYRLRGRRREQNRQ